jgi:hypothetical protein
MHMWLVHNSDKGVSPVNERLTGDPCAGIHRLNIAIEVLWKFTPRYYYSFTIKNICHVFT